ncbi:MAG: hypothetical protein AAF741_08525 [Bacteroidota bacterium]
MSRLTFITTAFAFALLLISSCGDTENATSESTDTSTETAQQTPATGNRSAPASSDAVPDQNSVEDIQAEKARLAQPDIDPEIDASKAFGRLEEVISITDAQKAQIEQIYADMALDEDASVAEIQTRNRQLRDKVYLEVLTTEQKEVIRAARRERKKN